MVVAALVAALVPGQPARAEAAARETPATVRFEGRQVDAKEVWKDAAACVVWSDQATECFRTVAQREAAEAQQQSSGEMGLASTCPVRLYTQIAYLGSELTLHTRWTWHNLANWGFNNATSSYKLAGCAATFRDGPNGAGNSYPGITTAWTWSATMAFGWNNRVSSVWVH